MRAAVYLRFPDSKTGQYYLEDYREQAITYCNEKGYDLIVLLELMGPGVIYEEIGKREILNLAKRKLVDVIILPHLYTISQSLAETSQMLCELQEFGTKTECMEYDLLEYTIHKLHSATLKKEEEKRCFSSFPALTRNFLRQIQQGGLR